MIGPVVRFLGRALLHKTVAAPAGRAVSNATGGLLDVKLGLRLMRDRRVPLTSKLMALSMGGVFALGLEVAQIPVEFVVGALLPLLGIAELAFDGIELLAASVLVAAIALPFLAPRALVLKIQQESDGRVYDSVGAHIG